MSRWICMALAFVSLGCIGVREGRVTPTSPWPSPAAAQPRPIRLTVAIGPSSANGRPVEPVAGELARWREVTEATYRESGHFSEVLPEGSSSDLRAEVSISTDYSFSLAMQFMCGLSLTLIPAVVTQDIAMHTEFKNADGELLAVIDSQDTVSEWIQAFAILAMPFARAQSVRAELLRDLNRATLAEARAKGAL